MDKVSGKSPGKADLSKLFLSIIFISLIIVPLVRMLMNVRLVTIKELLKTDIFYTAVRNSFMVSTTATVITIVVSCLAALCIQHLSIKCKGIFEFLFIVPMLIPSISHGMSLTVLFGNNGVITNLLALNTSIYGFWGVVTGSVLYAFPVAFLMFNDVLKYEDMSQYEAANVLGISKIRQFKIITYPYLRKQAISIIFAVFTMIVTDYGVPLMIGGKFMTVPVVLYQEVIGQLDFAKGAVYGIVLLIPAVISFSFDLFNADKGNTAFVTKRTMVATGGAIRVFAYGFLALISIFALMPVLIFGALAFMKKYPMDFTFTLGNFSSAFHLGAGGYLWNSVIVAVAVGLLGTGIAFLTAYLTARMKSRVSGFLHVSVLTSAAIPGIVLGLAYVLSFKGSLVYGTVIILVMVNLVHFLATPYLMIYNSFSKTNENLEAVGLTLGISRTRIVRDVLLPQNRYTLMEMFIYFFINSMMTISAVSFLATTRNKPVALMINQFEAQMQMECAAVVTVLIFILNATVKLSFSFIKSRGNKRHDYKKTI